LLKDFPRGILVIKMLPASLRPEEVDDKTTKDVKRLSDIGKASYMVPLDPGGLSSLSKSASPSMMNGQERVMSFGRSPFLPDVKEGLPSPFCKGALDKTVLRGFRGLLCANLASGEDPHAL
jgi:hypothetical protein